MTTRLFFKKQKAAGVAGMPAVLRKVPQWIALLLIAAVPSVSNAIQPDAEYLVREKQFGEQWAAEDTKVQQQLTALEKKFGKKPNIVFILADDIGYTELGSYGGGKVRGFSTPNLDRMADEASKSRGQVFLCDMSKERRKKRTRDSDRILKHDLVFRPPPRVIMSSESNRPSGRIRFTLEKWSGPLFG